ncbi:MAG: multicopper oxidase domain-containing protein [Alicyclobacillus sp.]|nr:multicopper oxidase domain-containing protein [Alicyclobacillus sp.]
MALYRWLAMGCSVCLLAGSVVGCKSALPSAPQAMNAVGAAGFQAGGSHMLAEREWLQTDQVHRRVMVTLVAGMGKREDNLNGYTNGAFTVAVPLGWTVVVHFRNASLQRPHSLMVVPFQTATAQIRQPAFAGAATPHWQTGTLPQQSASFQFVADKPGRFAFVCAIPHHQDRGMWAALTVTQELTKPRLYVKVEG